MEPNKNIPNTFLCELSHQLMKDPVLDRDGHSYEREVIIEHIQKIGSSPITLQQLSLNDLIPNLALKKTIEEYLLNKNLNVNEMNDQDKQKFNVASKNDLIVEASSLKDEVLLSIVPPNKMDDILRTPSTVVCVIDVSGSMGDEAKIKTDVDSKETYGFNTLDLVKHALRTIIKSLNKDDRLSLVSFSNNSKVVLELTTMDESGREKAYNSLNTLYPDASTNLWDGLYRGMEVLRTRKADDAHKNAAVLLLTDGMPNVEPPRGYIPQLQKYKDDLGGDLPGIINTFGFGYSLDSKLLNDIAVMGKGSYAFIPDGSFVGTIFVNSMSNLLSHVALNVVLELELNDLKLNESDLLKYYDKNTTDQRLQLKLSPILFGQTKSLALPISFLNNKNKVLTGSLKYNSPFQDSYNVPFQCKLVNINDPQAQIQSFRIQSGNVMLDAVDDLKMNPNNLKTYSALVEKLIHEITTSAVKDDKYIQDLIKDLNEQVSIALDKKEFYQKWGRHYLPSLARAHISQQCNNFKDPGVQHFGGEIFKNIRDKLDTLFLTLAAPEPSIKRETNVKVSNMANFYNSHGVCFHGDCKVLMIDRSYKLVKEIRKGDLIYSDSGKIAEVTCVVQTLIKQNMTGLVCLEGGLKITPWHPVKINGVYRFPIDLGIVVIEDCDAVYNFVLNEHHVMQINGVECVTLGHGLVENEVVKHQYFGTEEVIKDLEKIKGWGNGLVQLQKNWIERDEETGRIKKIAIL